MKRWKDWLVFVFLGGFAWGASFLWIKLAVQDVGPFALVMYRMGFGSLTAWILVLALKLPIRYTKVRLFGSMFVGAVGLALPITLLSWGETRIDSSMAGILNGTVPLWTLIIAHFALHDERITPQKTLGLIAGFIGIIVLVSRGLDLHTFGGSVAGEIAVIGMAICYAVTITFTRRYLQGQHPLQTAIISITTAFVCMLITTPIFESPVAVPHLTRTWIACAWLGVIGMGLAMWAHYYLIMHRGATFASLVTYLFPVTAVALGVVFLNEPLTWHLITGGVLIIGGIALVNMKSRKSIVVAR